MPINLNIGNAGRDFQNFYNRYISKYLANPALDTKDDGAIVAVGTTNLVMATDSFVINPLFFPGGNIGALAFNGTVNDLIMMGAQPTAITLSLIIEDGFDEKKLEEIFQSIGKLSKDYNIPVVTGDTKVVEKGKGDGIYINTTGLGIQTASAPSFNRIQATDKIIITGTMGDHAVAIMAQREGLEFSEPLISDCACLQTLLLPLVDKNLIEYMRDPTRGGVAAVVNEIQEQTKLGFCLWEDQIPLHPAVKGTCQLMGLDPLELANEGKAILIVKEENTEEVLELLGQHPQGKNATVIGEVNSSDKVELLTKLGSRRPINMPVNSPLPRIC
jgi:hydrogenase expression/formation protein HypE